MSASFRSLRFKLTMLFVVSFGLVQAGIWIAVDVVLSRHLSSRFDRMLIDRAQGMVRTIEAAPPGSTAEQFEILLKPFGSDESYYVLRGRDGSAIARSENLRGFGLPAPPRNGGEATQLETVIARVPSADTGTGTELRVVTLCAADASSPYCMQVAAERAPMRKVIGEVRRLLMLCMFVGLAAAAFTSWFMARRSLAPLGSVARRTRLLSAARLDQRFPIPESRDEVSDFISEFNGMLNRLETEFRHQAQFIANVSHELRTPLAVLLGEAQAIERAKHDPEECRRFFRAVQEEARHLLRTVESFLILTRAKEGARLTVVQEVALEDVVCTAVQRCRSNAQARGVYLVPRIDHMEAACEPMVGGDFDLLCSMVENLVHNAVRHSPTGETVEIDTSCSQKIATISVVDHGSGIPEDQLDRVFDLFYQVQPKTRSGKSGIGLSIVKAVCELHGGSVTVRNRPAGGCAFTVRLPLLASVTTS